MIVVAAVVEEDDTFLVTRRLRGTHLEGYWEFPGGKREDGETDHQSLTREMREEVATEIRVEDEILRTVHAYPSRTVELRFYRCTLLGRPRPRLGQQMRWVPRGQLATLRFPPADDELIQTLTAPSRRTGEP